MYTIAQLKTELTTDPKAMGYAANLTSTHDINNAALLNALTGPGAANVPVTSLTRGAWDAALIPLEDLVVAGVNTSGAALAAGVQAKWNARIASLRAADPVISVAVMMPLLNSAVADGILTATEITAITTRTGSRAEVLFGTGTVIPWLDVMNARMS